MAGGTFDIAKGAIIEKLRVDPTKLTVLLLTESELDATLETRTNVSNILTASGNSEATFTNYARINDITGTIIIEAGEARADMDNQLFAAAGGALNNSLVKVIIAYAEDTGDFNLIPLTHHDFVFTTNGNDLPIVINNDGFFRARNPL